MAVGERINSILRSLDFRVLYPEEYGFHLLRIPACFSSNALSTKPPVIRRLCIGNPFLPSINGYCL